MESDTVGFRVKDVDPKPTRRNILSQISQVYDPLGYAAPFILNAKKILQTCCKNKIGWDDTVPTEQQQQWERWYQDLPRLEELQIDRCYKPEAFGRVSNRQLHHFADASQDGYGTVTYLRLTNEEGEVHTAFVTAKARVAPLKPHTIVKMELTAATTSVKQDTLLKKELNTSIDSTTFWTDSQTVLKYIANPQARYPVFVGNRVAVICDGSDIQQWKYIPTDLNPADYASRGLSADQLIKRTEWWKGPQFLKRPEEEWPTEEEPVFDEDSEEPLPVAVNVNAANVKEEQQNPVDMLLEYYSKWHSLKKAVAYILKLKTILRQKVKMRHEATASAQIKSADDDKSKPLALKDIQKAEEAILQYVQHKFFPEEIEALQKGSQSTRSSSIYKLDPQMKDGMLRVGGRLLRSALPEESKHPVILPKESHITNLILLSIHETVGHSGRNHMIAYSRKKYWIIKVNSAARSVINRCVICRKQRGRLLQQKMADLPEERIQPEEPPFSKVGMDYFGPFEVKRGRVTMKRYGVMFTCMTTRAVHLEMADSLDTDSCINAIRRFTSRRGQVTEMRSDNGTNLIGAQREMKAEIDKWNLAMINDELLQKGIRWSFNPPAASHFGGIWERQIRTVRKVMLSVLKEQKLIDESLRTVLCEIEAIINGRPITTVSNDVNDVEALTPNHILLMKGKPVLPPLISQETDRFRRRWKQVQYLSNLFWKRWSREYLSQLQQRQKWCKPQRNVEVGDVVLIVNDKAPRNSWTMGRVIRTYPDNRGQVRQATIKTKSTILTRPVAKLCMLLEVDIPEPEKDSAVAKSAVTSDLANKSETTTAAKKSAVRSTSDPAATKTSAANSDSVLTTSKKSAAKSNLQSETTPKSSTNSYPTSNSQTRTVAKNPAMKIDPKSAAAMQSAVNSSSDSAAAAKKFAANSKPKSTSDKKLAVESTKGKPTMKPALNSNQCQSACSVTPSENQEKVKTRAGRVVKKREILDL